MSLADFMLTKRQQRLLGALFMNPDRDYSLSELVRVSGSGMGAGQNQVNRLISAGVLLEERQGNQRRLRVNRSFPLFDELRSICIKSFGLVETLREALAPIQDAIEEAFVFGSVAKATDTAESDIDLLVIGSISLLDLNRCLADAETKVTRTISVQLYGRDEWLKAKSDPVIANIANGPRLQVLPDADSNARDSKPSDGTEAVPQGGDRRS